MNGHLDQQQPQPQQQRREEIAACQRTAMRCHGAPRAHGVHSHVGVQVLERHKHAAPMLAHYATHRTVELLVHEHVLASAKQLGAPDVCANKGHPHSAVLHGLVKAPDVVGSKCMPGTQFVQSAGDNNNSCRNCCLRGWLGCGNRANTYKSASTTALCASSLATLSASSAAALRACTRINRVELKALTFNMARNIATTACTLQHGDAPLLVLRALWRAQQLCAPLRL